MEGKIYKDFHELPLWRDGYNALMIIYDLTATFPPTEQYALISQLQRSANSVIANIAEAQGRFSFNDKARVLYISRGEILETRSHLAVAFGRKYIDREKFIKLNLAYTRLAKDLNVYIKSLKS